LRQHVTSVSFWDSGCDDQMGKIVSDSHTLSIAELRSAFSRGALTPSQHLHSIYGRIAHHDPGLRAFVALDKEAAFNAARECDERYLEDTQRPLEGVPVAVKCNIAVKGLVNSAGMAARDGMVATQDAAIIAKLRASGALIIGTLNMDEAAFGAATDNPFFGQCVNPHGDGFSPGGSSGGSAAAVAAGLCSAAIGTDTLGSIRIPASYCGIFGLKPSHRVADLSGIVPLDLTLDTAGPLTRSMEDLAFLSNVLFAPDLSVAMQRSRYLTLANLGGGQLDDEIEVAFAFAVSQLRESPVDLALADDCARIALAAFVQAGRALVNDLVQLGEEQCTRISPQLAGRIDYVLARSEEDLAADAAILARTRTALRSAIGSNGILITPTVSHTAFRHGEPAPVDQAIWTALANVAGLPAVSLPLGRTLAGMPFGLQLIGPEGGEALLTAQARMFNEMLKAYAPPIDCW
jgi:aspartyl-tRNA(Asn)/glutamyl-tRNA(Gln) amidotransferase subunit A